MRRSVIRSLAWSALLAGALSLGLAAIAPTSPTRAQREGLVAGGSRARSGVHELRAGFTPDPFSIPLRPGGSLHAAQLRLGPGCRGYVDPHPDVIIRFSGRASFLRFFARSSEDVTLIVNDPSGRYLCNDDVNPGRETNPMVDVYQPRGGQYDVWVGAHDAGARPTVTLYVTELRTQRP